MPPKPTTVPDLEALHLKGYDEKSGPPKSRLNSVSHALALYSTLLHADEGSATNRARIDAMFDGAPPLSPSRLAATDQQGRINLNFGDGQRLLDINMSAYVDLYSSLECLVDVYGTLGDVSVRKAYEHIVSYELTHLLRSWPEFHSLYLRLCTIFVKHGVAITYFDSPEGWKFRVAGLQDFFVPRQTPATESAVDVAIARRAYQVHELNEYISDPKVAAKVGWNVAEARRVLSKNVTTSERPLYGDYETLQAELKNNDVSIGARNPAVRTLHFWVREFDGTVSHLICAEDGPQEFLYRKTSRFKSPEQAYTLFVGGVGTNGTIHSIRGLGQRIFAHVQTSNRLRSTFVEGAMLSSQAIVQPESQRALDQLSFTTWGPFSLLSPDVKIVDRAVPNLTNSVKPALDDLAQQLALNTDTVSPYGPNRASPYRNETQVITDLDVATRLSGATLNLFYASWERLLREVVRRIIETPKGKDSGVDKFRIRCEERGVPPEFLATLDLSRTCAVRAVGGGSAAARIATLREFLSLAGNLDETGRHNLYRDIFATRVGYDLADRYIPERVEPRPTMDVKIAQLENTHLSEGREIAVVEGEMHGTHLDQHLPVLEQMVSGFNEGTLDPMQSLPAFKAYYLHISQHAQAAAADPALQGLAGGIKKLLNFAEEIIHNMSKALQNMQRMEMEQQGAEGQAAPEGGAPNPMLQTRLEEHQTRMAIAREKADLEMTIKREKFEQERAIADARNALRMSQDGNIV